MVIVGLFIIGGTLNQKNAASPAPIGNSASSQASPGSAEQNVPSGDIPDNAIFLTYNSISSGYSLQYIEGWVVTERSPGGVDIRDKDSSESVQVEPLSSDNLSAYIQQVDIPKLKANTTAFEAKNPAIMELNGRSIITLSYTSLSGQDPVTGKQRPVISDRYYLPGAGRLAIITLTTPIGVDNVDAFNQILNSFQWK